MPFLFYLFLFGKLTLFILIRNSNTSQNEVGGGKLVYLRFAPVRSVAILTGGNFFPFQDLFLLRIRLIPLASILFPFALFHFTQLLLKIILRSVKWFCLRCAADGRSRHTI